jgi:hypothetical protein
MQAYTNTAMKAKFLFGLICVFLVISAISCKDDDPEWRLTTLSVKNMNNAGEQPFLSDDSIPKEAYAVDILYVGWNLDNKADYSRIDFKNCKDTVVAQKIICNTALDEKFTAGSDVTELFKPLYGMFTGNSSSNKWHGGTFILKYVPNRGVHSFKALVYLANGNIIEKSTKPVMLY